MFIINHVTNHVIPPVYHVIPPIHHVILQRMNTEKAAQATQDLGSYLLQGWTMMVSHSH